MGAHAEPLPRFAGRPVGAVAALLTALLIATAGGYGYHRDELYFLVAGRHLAWGYPDQPVFVPLVARLMNDLSPGSLTFLRLPSALAAGALVLLTGLLTRELGGRGGAQLLAAATIAVAGVVEGSGHTLNTTIFGLVDWGLLWLLIARILRTGEQRLWLAVGLVTGLGLLDSDLVAFLMFAVVVGLAVSGPRRPFASPWLYAGGLLAIAMWTPYLVWQARHGWPELTVARSIANGGSGSSAPRWAILPEQLILLGPFLAAVWIAGLWRLLRSPTLRSCRALGVAYPVLAIVFIATGGKPYYLAGTFPLLLAAGAPPALAWMRRGRPRLRGGLTVAAFVLSLGAAAIVTLPLVPARDLHNTSIVKTNYDAGETVGWPAIVGEIAHVYTALPAQQRRATAVLTSNYGEAGAIDRYGPADGLPAAYSGHMGFWYWGPPPDSASQALLVGFDQGHMRGICLSARLAAFLDNHVKVDDDEQGAPVWVCPALRARWSLLWPALKDFG